MSYADLDKDGVLEQDERIVTVATDGSGNATEFFVSCIVEENNYYPFGLKHSGYNEGGFQASKYKTKFNNREWQDELGLNMTAMDYRQYDNALGRFNSIDALAELMTSTTPYHFGYSNPVYWADPSGLSPSNGKTTSDIANALFENSGSGRTDWINDGGGFWSITASNSGNGGLYDSNTGVFTYSVLMPEAIIPVGVREGSERFFNILRGQTYWKSPFYKGWRSMEFSRQMDQFQNGLDWLGTAPLLGEPIDLINAGISAVRGRYAAAGLSLAATVPVAGWAAFGIKQSHHVIPKAVYKEFKSDLAGIIKRDGKANLMDLPVPYHLGGHNAYNDYVTNALNNIKADIGITPGSIEALQGQLRGMINEGLENFNKTGENLNTYFKQF